MKLYAEVVKYFTTTSLVLGTFYENKQKTINILCDILKNYIFLEYFYNHNWKHITAIYLLWTY